MKRTILLVVITLSAVITCFSQHVQRCSSMEYLQKLEAENPSLKLKRSLQETISRNWILAQAGGSQQTVINIPVVFHILYNDTTQNLSDAVVLSQLDVINEDYRRQNPDTGQTPLAFRSVAADCEIQFCLAQRTPGGQSTNGIIHKFTSVASFNDYEQTKFNQFGGDDAWDASKYMNVWVAAFSNPNFLGIGTFPNSVPPESDGIVINFKACGRIGDHLMDHYNKGRSLTHEVGHWLNLLHVWGDDGHLCSSDDGVSDTPLQSGETYGCPAYPRYDSCSSSLPGVMFMNYMDYTDDECMNIFTEGQKMRMLSALNLDRTSLLTSDGCLGVGISENEIRKYISVFPNPASRELTIKSERMDITGYEIQNVVGKTITSDVYPLPFTETILDVSTFSPGIYFLRIHTASGDAVYKVVKQ
jgi:hypothetical protein